jgi:hypothetical protein
MTTCSCSGFTLSRQFSVLKPDASMIHYDLTSSYFEEKMISYYLDILWTKKEEMSRC